MFPEVYREADGRALARARRREWWTSAIVRVAVVLAFFGAMGAIEPLAGLVGCGR